jgi:hypothetical protein
MRRFTPLFEGIDDLRGELNFCGAPFAANTEDGFYNFLYHQMARTRHACYRHAQVVGILLRRSKSMTIRDTGMPILGLKPLTVGCRRADQYRNEPYTIFFWSNCGAGGAIQ